MEDEENEFFREDDEVFDRNSGLITEGIENADERGGLREVAAHLPVISEEDNTIQEPSLVNAVYSCQGDFRFNESGEEDNTVGNDAKMQPESCIVSSAKPLENVAHDESKAFYSQQMNFTAGSVSKTNFLTMQDSLAHYQTGMNESRVKDATFAEKSKIDYSRNHESTLRNSSYCNLSRPKTGFAPQATYKNLEQTYFDENLAASSFKCGAAALDLINKDGEILRETQALRLPSQTFFGSPSGGFGFDKTKGDLSKQLGGANQMTNDSFRGLKEITQEVINISQVPVDANSKKVDICQVLGECDQVKADCSRTLGGTSQSTQSKSEPKQVLISNLEDKVVPSSFSLPTKENAPTFLLDTSKGSHSPPLLDVDKPCMYFGFRQLNYESMDVLNLNVLVDAGMIIRCRLKPVKNEAFRILYKADLKQKIRAFGTYSVYISFCPKQAARYRATLHIDCLSQKNESAEYTCQLLGFGGQSMVNPLLNPPSKSKRDLVMSAGGRFVMIPKSINKFSFLLENKGTRDAFASVILQDVNGDEIPTENAFVQPANLLLDKASQSNKKIEVRMFVQNAGSRRNSFVSNASSRISSAVNNTTGCALPTAFRILVLWGEERQRQRLKMLERRKREKFYFLNRHFTITRYEGEQVAWEDATDELLSKEDYRMFEGYLRVTVIEILDKRYSRFLQENAFKSRPTSATGNTVIELEPDNTNNFGQSMLSSIAE